MNNLELESDLAPIPNQFFDNFFYEDEGTSIITD
jgi:hypothetical protein